MHFGSYIAQKISQQASHLKDVATFAWHHPMKFADATVGYYARAAVKAVKEDIKHVLSGHIDGPLSPDFDSSKAIAKLIDEHMEKSRRDNPQKELSHIDNQWVKASDTPVRRVLCDDSPETASLRGARRALNDHVDCSIVEVGSSSVYEQAYIADVNTLVLENGGEAPIVASESLSVSLNLDYHNYTGPDGTVYDMIEIPLNEYRGDTRTARYPTAAYYAKYRTETMQIIEVEDTTIFDFFVQDPSIELDSSCTYINSLSAFAPLADVFSDLFDNSQGNTDTFILAFTEAATASEAVEALAVYIGSCAPNHLSAHLLDGAIDDTALNAELQALANANIIHQEANGGFSFDAPNGEEIFFTASAVCTTIDTSTSTTPQLTTGHVPTTPVGSTPGDSTAPVSSSAPKSTPGLTTPPATSAQGSTSVAGSSAPGSSTAPPTSAEFTSTATHSQSSSASETTTLRSSTVVSTTNHASTTAARVVDARDVLDTLLTFDPISPTLIAVNVDGATGEDIIQAIGSYFNNCSGTDGIHRLNNYVHPLGNGTAVPSTLSQLMSAFADQGIQSSNLCIQIQAMDTPLCARVNCSLTTGAAIPTTAGYTSPFISSKSTRVSTAPGTSVRVTTPLKTTVPPEVSATSAAAVPTSAGQVATSAPSVRDILTSIDPTTALSLTTAHALTSHALLSSVNTDTSNPETGFDSLLDQILSQAIDIVDASGVNSSALAEAWDIADVDPSAAVHMLGQWLSTCSADNFAHLTPEYQTQFHELLSQFGDGFGESCSADGASLGWCLSVPGAMYAIGAVSEIDARQLFLDDSDSIFPQGFDPTTGAPVFDQTTGARVQGYDPTTGAPIFDQTTGTFIQNITAANPTAVLGYCLNFACDQLGGFEGGPKGLYDCPVDSTARPTSAPTSSAIIGPESTTTNSSGVDYSVTPGLTDVETAFLALGATIGVAAIVIIAILLICRLGNKLMSASRSSHPEAQGGIELTSKFASANRAFPFSLPATGDRVHKVKICFSKTRECPHEQSVNIEPESAAERQIPVYSSDKVANWQEGDSEIIRRAYLTHLHAQIFFDQDAWDDNKVDTTPMPAIPLCYGILGKNKHVLVGGQPVFTNSTELASIVKTLPPKAFMTHFRRGLAKQVLDKIISGELVFKRQVDPSAAASLDGHVSRVSINKQSDIEITPESRRSPATFTITIGSTTLALDLDAIEDDHFLHCLNRGHITASKVKKAFGRGSIRLERFADTRVSQDGRHTSATPTSGSIDEGTNDPKNYVFCATAPGALYSRSAAAAYVDDVRVHVTSTSTATLAIDFDHWTFPDTTIVGYRQLATVEAATVDQSANNGLRLRLADGNIVTATYHGATELPRDFDRQQFVAELKAYATRRVADFERNLEAKQSTADATGHDDDGSIDATDDVPAAAARAQLVTDAEHLGIREDYYLDVSQLQILDAAGNLVEQLTTASLNALRSVEVMNAAEVGDANFLENGYLRLYFADDSGQDPITVYNRNDDPFSERLAGLTQVQREGYAYLLRVMIAQAKPAFVASEATVDEIRNALTAFLADRDVAQADAVARLTLMAQNISLFTTGDDSSIKGEALALVLADARKQLPEKEANTADKEGENSDASDVAPPPPRAHAATQPVDSAEAIKATVTSGLSAKLTDFLKNKDGTLSGDKGKTHRRLTSIISKWPADLKFPAGLPYSRESAALNNASLRVLIVNLANALARHGGRATEFGATKPAFQFLRNLLVNEARDYDNITKPMLQRVIATETQAQTEAI